MREALEKAGLTPEAITEKIKELLDSTKLYGKDAIEHPDNQARLGAVDAALKITGAYAPTKTELTGADGKDLVPRKLPRLEHADIVAAFKLHAQATRNKGS